MGFEVSITSLIRSAKLERDNILEKIDYMVNYRFVELLQDSQALVASYNRIKEMLGLEIDLENTMLDFVNRNSSNLNAIAKKISAIEISEENLIGEVEDFIGNSQNLLEKMEFAIKEAKSNLLKSLENQIIMGYQNKIQLDWKNGIDIEEIIEEDENEGEQGNNDVKKAFSERIKAKLSGEKRLVRKSNNKANKENIK